MRLPLFAIFALLGCSEPEPPDYCLPVEGETPSAVIGKSAGTNFVAFAADEEVSLDVAPQGGYGVKVAIQTFALLADNPTDVDLIVEYEGDELGRFTQTNHPLFCNAGNFGLLNDLVVGFSEEDFPELSDLAEFDGKIVDLVVEVRDQEGNAANASWPVTINFGG